MSFRIIIVASYLFYESAFVPSTRTTFLNVTTGNLLDFCRKYERGKAVNEALKKNEDLLKKSLNDYEVTVKTVENKYELLKSHATSQLDK